MPFTQQLLQAIRFATLAHHGQQRKGESAPYAVHPVRVAETVAALTEIEPETHRAMILAAVLHDVIEDSPTTPAELEAEFGARVTELVVELSQDTSLPRDQRKASMLAKLASMSHAAKLIKLADRLDNVRSMRTMAAGFVARYCTETRHLLEQLAATDAGLEQQIRACVDTADPPSRDSHS